MERAHDLIRDLLSFSFVVLLAWNREEGAFGDRTHFEYSIRFMELSRILSIKVHRTKSITIPRSNHAHRFAQQGHQAWREERVCESKSRFAITVSPHIQQPSQTAYRNHKNSRQNSS